MKKITVLIALLYCVSANAQKIEESAFDKFDSVYKISTTEEILVGKILSSKYLSIECNSIDIRKSEYQGQDHQFYHVYFLFKANSVTSVSEENSFAKIQFTDDSIKEYSHFGRYNIFSSDDVGILAIKVSPDDDIFKKEIKEIRISTSDMNIDYKIPSNKEAKIKACLNLIKTEVVIKK